MNLKHFCWATRGGNGRVAVKLTDTHFSVIQIAGKPPPAGGGFPAIWITLKCVSVNLTATRPLPPRVAQQKCFRFMSLLVSLFWRDTLTANLLLFSLPIYELYVHIFQMSSPQNDQFQNWFQQKRPPTLGALVDVQLSA